MLQWGKMWILKMPIIQAKMNKSNLAILKPELQELIKSTKENSLSFEFLNAVINQIK